MLNTAGVPMDVVLGVGSVKAQRDIGGLIKVSRSEPTAYLSFGIRSVRGDASAIVGGHLVGALVNVLGMVHGGLLWLRTTVVMVRNDQCESIESDDNGCICVRALGSNDAPVIMQNPFC